MDNRAQVSLEYLIMIAVGLFLAGIVVLLVGNIFAAKEGVKANIRAFRTRVLQVV